MLGHYLCEEIAPSPSFLKFHHHFLSQSSNNEYNPSIGNDLSIWTHLMDENCAYIDIFQTSINILQYMYYGHGSFEY